LPWLAELGFDFGRSLFHFYVHFCAGVGDGRLVFCGNQPKQNGGDFYEPFTALVRSILSIEVQSSLLGTGRNPGLSYQEGEK
jgi:hypothetical protein